MTLEELTARLPPEDVAESDRIVADAPPMTARQLATLTALLSPAVDRAA